MTPPRPPLRSVRHWSHLLRTHGAAQLPSRDLGGRDGIVASLKNRAKIVHDRRDLDGAMALYEEAERLYRELGDKEGALASLRDQAHVLRDGGDLDGVLALLALLLFAVVAEAQNLKFVPFSKSGIYRLGEKAGWAVFPAQGEDAPATKYVYEIKKNNLDTIQTGTLDFTSGRATIEATLEEPATLYVTVNAEGATPASAVHLGAVIEPTQLKPSVPRPADFDTFWDAKLQSLSLVPMYPVLTPVSAKDGVELSTVQLDGWNSQVHGYLAKPVKPGRLPALVIFPYAGVYALRPQTVTARAAQGWLAFYVSAHDLPPDLPSNQAANVSRRYQAIGNTNRETSYFLGMYLRNARAVDYIASRPDWDGKTLVVMGTCMGGQQALATAGLRRQVSAVIVNKPSGADSNGELHGRKPGYPDWPSGDASVMAAALYFDTVNFASRINAPVLAGVGLIDTTAPPDGIWIALNQIPGPKEVVIMESDHLNYTPEKQGVFDSRVEQVLDILRRGGAFPADQ